MTDKERELYNAANAYAFDLDEGDLNTNRDTFIAGAEWQKEQMMKDAIEINDATFADIKIDGINGNKIKVLIIKEE